jgi:hypothetical protein
MINNIKSFGKIDQKTSNVATFTFRKLGDVVHEICKCRGNAASRPEGKLIRKKELGIAGQSHAE